jgi:diguanylate cyclase (GGDEF)-like protein
MSPLRPHPVAPDDAQPRTGQLDTALARAALLLDPIGPDHTGAARVRLLAVLCGVGYVFAALCALAGPVFSPHSVHPLYGEVIAGAVAAAVGAALLMWRSMPPRLVRFLSLQFNIVQASVMVALLTPAYPLLVFYVWGGFTAGYFGTRSDALATAGLIYVGAAIGIALSTLPVPGIGYVTTVGVAIPPIFVLRALRTRRDMLMLEFDQAASTDALTGLANRRSFVLSLEREFGRVQRDGSELAIAVFDLDHFKAINDNHGHAAGDLALQRFAGLLAAETAQSDLCSRVGGEEFTLILPGCDHPTARDVAQRLIDYVARMTARDEIPFTASCGVAAVTPAVHTADELLIAADRALYAAKGGGRNQVAVASELDPRSA